MLQLDPQRHMLISPTTQMAVKRVLIVGSGPTGAVIAHLLAAATSSPPSTLSSLSQPPSPSRPRSDPLAGANAAQGGQETGAAAASSVSAASAPVEQRPPRLEITVWDKGRDIGGRMSTSVSRRATAACGARGCGQDDVSTTCAAAQADIGAQYITRSTPVGEDAVADAIYTRLQTDGVLRPLAGAVVGQAAKQAALPNFVAPAGTASIPKHLLATAPGVVVRQGLRVIDITECAGVASSHGVWQCTAVEEGSSSPRRVGAVPDGALPLESVSRASTGSGVARAADASGTAPVHVASFDAVVVTVPAPQVLGLNGSMKELLESSGTAERLSHVAYSSRYALALFYESTAAAAVQAAVPFTAWYVPATEDAVIRYIAFDSQKREAAADGARGSTARRAATFGPPSVVVHTSTEFGESHVDDAIEAVEVAIRESLARLLPSLPQPMATKLHRWRYSQVTKPMVQEQEPSGTGHQACAGAAVLSQSPPLLLAGDYFSRSHFDGCIASARSAVTMLLHAMR